MDHRADTYIGGRWAESRGEDVIAVLDPSTGHCVATVRESAAEDVDAAVAAAEAARPELRAMGAQARAALLGRIADELEGRAALLAGLISREMGMPRKHCEAYQVRTAVTTLRNTATAVRQVEFTERIGGSSVRREPVGVVAAITPWNFPLLQTVAKIGPALAAGCPVVLKPSEITPLDAFVLAEAVHAAGAPPGAFNVVIGNGMNVGEYLVGHPGTAMVSLTGSTRAGRRVARLAAPAIKRVSLELGGKSASVVLPDGDLAAAIAGSVRTVVINSGQTCTALTRLLVPFQRLAETETLVAEAMAGYRVGMPDDPDADVGPLASAGQQHRVNDHLERAPVDGARTIWAYPSDGIPRTGFYAGPAAFAVSDPRIPLAQQEVFGPLLAVIPYVDEADAVEIANGTEYGLAAAVWSADEERALRVADLLEAGSVAVNGAPFNGLAPFGGYKRSGYGRELGVHGITEFTELKSVQVRAGAAG
ncbi:aldehyde dehydrogenase family protein [Spongiactinospora sp. TRM90649]|uniref:aldehyde dehydrogenase family protein n=1 Tax=Spongiactinospora sp. TRM90649 TaxID=3031114 RepID=UPI0023F9995E|nr:aldehyde dehydrogenase family protein [Spongiactinospora sp. TRM90649]MDF5751665.1 aldehyde dehydrogenase family protein [Spongiactinospora sp. TRM90649]